MTVNTISSLYENMHRIALLGTLNELMEYIYCTESIERLEELKTFYVTHHRLIPPNIKLRLCYPKTTTLVDVAIIPGTGIIDSDYQQTAQEMQKFAGTVEVPAYVDAARSKKPRLILHNTLFVPSTNVTSPALTVDLEESKEPAPQISNQKASRSCIIS